METKVTENGDSAEIELIGRLDTTTYKEAEALFTEVANRVNSVTLNMAQLSYISSAGIRSLRSLYMILYNKGGKLTVTNVCEVVMDVFEMTGLKTFFNVVE